MLLSGYAERAALPLRCHATADADAPPLRCLRHYYAYTFLIRR